MSRKRKNRAAGPNVDANTTVPGGGDGASSRCSRVFFLPVSCPIKLNGDRPSGSGRWFSEQVTQIRINEKVYARKYGHDKSFCAQDSTTGLASWDGSLTTFVQCNNKPFSFHAGQILWLDVYPLGTSRNDARISGYALIESSPTVMNLENGDPVSRTYDFSSKGWWQIPEGMDGTFDCCNCCEGIVGNGSTSVGFGSDGSFGFGSMAVEAATATPVTAYQWSGTAWTVAKDEAGGDWVQGPMPTEPPVAPNNYPGVLKFVECVLG
jgi:hypothetical protein